MSVSIRRFHSRDADFVTRLDALRAFESSQNADTDRKVHDILAAVKARGDAALLEFTHRFDRWQPASADGLEIHQAQLQSALAKLAPAIRAALETAATRIRTYHEHQIQKSWTITDAEGTVLGAQITPLDRAGLYVPGGKAAYPSSVLMNAIAAKVAGVGELIMVTPTPDGVVNETVLAAAALAGVDRVFRIGGAQAVGALAYGTETIPAVDKIVGPGNEYVAAAKRQVFGVVGIDMVAGPSEILVIADAHNDPRWIAADLLSQAEHDPAAQSILITDDAGFADAVIAMVADELARLPTRAVASESWDRYGTVIVIDSLDEAAGIEEAAGLANALAAEHVEIATADPESLFAAIRHAGSVFLGRMTPEAVGDYLAGPNHVLPTGRRARFASGLSVLDFMKRTSFISANQASLAAVGPAAVALAHAEGLAAHARSIELRLHP